MLITALVFLVLIFLGVGAFIGYQKYMELLAVPGAGTPVSVAVSSQKVSGWLTLSLAPVSTSSQQYQGVYLFTANAATSQLSFVEGADQLTGEKKIFVQQHRFSPDGKWAVFVGQGLASGNETILRAPQIYRADTSAGTDTATIVAALQGAKAISESTDFKRTPVISNTGDVLYASVPFDAPVSTSPEAWNIIYEPVQGIVQTLVKGSYPQWVDGNRFIFLKSDGIHMYDMTTRVTSKISDAGGTITSNSMMDLSDDKSLIVWSMPEKGTVALLRVLDWNTPTVTNRGSLSITGTWPTISPDASALAILTSQNTPGSSSGQHVAFFSLETLEPIATSVTVLDSDPVRTALTDWTK